MKKLFTLLLSLFLLQSISYGQSVPQGMKYQAAARDEKGQVMGNQFIQLKVTLYSDPVRRDVEYEEIHKVMTNELGLFSLSIGEGLTNRGQFKNVPWSEKEIWMQIAIQADDETDFITISDSKMLSVPYAFHAATASEITGGGDTRGGTGDPYIKTWSLLSNFNTVPGRDVLGTGDMADLVIVTNSKERIRVLDEGDVIIGQSTEVGNDLTVRKNVYLNTAMPGGTHPASFEQGETINYGDFTVEEQSRTYLTGTLEVDEHTELNSTLNVDGITTISNATQSSHAGNGALSVDGGVGIARRLNVGEATTLSSTLDVAGVTNISNTAQANDINSGALIVDGGVGIAKNLHVGGSANFAGETTFSGSLQINDDTESTNTTNGAMVIAGGVGIGKNLNIGGNLSVREDNTGFVAKIENINSGTGDGLEIKLGKTHPAWDGSAYANVPNFQADIIDGQIATVRGWIEGEPFEFTDLLGLVGPAYLAGSTCAMVETLSGELNSALGLPVNFPGVNDVIIFDAFNSFADPLLNDDWRPDNPTTLIPGFNLAFPTDFCPDWLPALTPLNIEFVNVNNSLTRENQFLSFKDKDNRELGSVRAMSVTEWGENYFDGVFLVNFVANTVSLDPLDIALSAIKEFTTVADSYNEIGVEYASGHGDYAEWLERKNPAEVISRGDIVAVKGGKITKDLSGAEQVMAVSAFPIVLGNAPDKAEAHLGNNVAFMGQIPVKVMGPVQSGDYIIADTKVPGYGVAKAQDKLTNEDMPFVVGRSWESKSGDGPKLVNTVVGVHNGDYFRILKNYEQKLAESEARIQQVATESASRMATLESRVDMLMDRMEGGDKKMAAQK